MSLLPQINIIHVESKPLLGGTTRPLTCIGEDGNEYVVKAFSKRDTSQRCYIAAEVIGLLLAQDFDLNVSEGAYLTFSPEMLLEVSGMSDETRRLLEEKDLSKPLFGSKMQDGFAIYADLGKPNIGVEDIESIFAFDMFIANQDRRREKPNLLVADESFLLIDHEKAFGGYKKGWENYERGIAPYYFKEHLFYEQLRKQSRKREVTQHFETFLEYARTLNFIKIRENLKFIEDKGYNVEECYEWLSYLEIGKRNCYKFVDILRNLISE
jgi:hypothetical protein